MSEAPSWLSVSLARAEGSGVPASGAFLFSIPKKAVRLATRRNRVRRVLREALRGMKIPDGTVYRFRVSVFPEDLTLHTARAAVAKAIERAEKRKNRD